MIRTLIVVLIVSLGLNVTQYWVSAQSRRQDLKPVSLPPEVDNKTDAVSSRKTMMEQSNSVAGGNEGQPRLRTLALKLQEMGFPPQAIRLAVAHALNLEYEQQAADILLPRSLPYWKALDQSNEHGRKALEQLTREKMARLETLLEGIAEADYESELGKRRRERNWGDLSPEKIAEVVRINNDYDEMVRKANRLNLGGESAITAERHLHEERNRDLAAALSPDEFKDYLRRQERGVPRLMSELSAIDITEEEYRRLFDSRLAAEETTRFQPTNLDTLLSSRVAYNASNQEFRSTLGDERFKEYIRRHDADYRAVDGIVTANQLPAGTTLHYWETRTHLENQAQQLLADSAVPAAVKRERLTQMLTSATANLQETLGSAAYRDFEAQAGGWLQRLSAMRDRLGKEGPSG